VSGSKVVPVILSTVQLVIGPSGSIHVKTTLLKVITVLIIPYGSDNTRYGVLTSFKTANSDQFSVSAQNIL